MEDAILTYQVFVATEFDERHLLYAYNFDDEEDSQQFLDDVVSARDMASIVRDDVEVTAKDHVITLSTCVFNENKRFLVGAVLVDEQREE